MDLYGAPADEPPAALPALYASAVATGRAPLELGQAPPASVILIEIEVAGVGS